jgi:putative colanic acid biosynthesis acetyltransferase WcaF
MNFSQNMSYIKYVDNISTSDKIKRKIWLLTSYVLFKPFGARFFNWWRIFILRCYGAKISSHSVVYSSVSILAPWNLEIGQHSVIGSNVRLHIGKVKIGNKVTISQNSYLCTGSHEISSINLPYFSKPIIVENFAWVAAEAFIGPGVTIGEGAVVGARAAVFKDVEPWTVVGGNPAKFIKKREIKN